MKYPVPEKLKALYPDYTDKELYIIIKEHWNKFFRTFRNKGASTSKHYLRTVIPYIGVLKTRKTRTREIKLEKLAKKYEYRIGKKKRLNIAKEKANILF